MIKRFCQTALIAAMAYLLALPAFADSQARVVRLSSVEGNVQVDRNSGQGYEKAFLNMPITQGNKLRTSEDGRAEVEFEDSSTLRVTPNSVLEFPQLSLRDSGAKASTVEIKQGTTYVNFRGEKNAEFTLNFGREKVALTKPVHLRIELADAESTLAVFKGDVKVEGQSGPVDVSKKHAVTFDLADNDKYELAGNFEEDPYDSWDKQQEQYHDRYMASNYSNYSPYMYGTSDLNYYGNFYSVPGYGTVWQPYFTGFGWDPFMNGAWMWYPGYGYSWVSGYPWGWTPYHYGSWIFAPGYGWVWQPGGAWAGWYTNPRVINPPPRFNPPHPPSTPGNTTVVVNRGGFTPPGGPASRKIIIRNDSAGLGIPRGSIRDLGKVNQKVSQEGSVAVKLHPAPVVLASPTQSSMSRSTAGSTPGVRPSAPVSRPAPVHSTPHMSAPSPHASSPTPHASTPHR